MIKFEEGQTYVCTNAEMCWWTEGKEYSVFNHKYFDTLVIKDDTGTNWFEEELTNSLNEFKLKEEKQMLTFKEGQTYICTNSDKPWWTEGKEYKVVFDSGFEPRLEDDDGDWYTQNSINNKLTKFKLKEEPQAPKFDLNKLTHEELRIYCDLVEDLNEAQNSLDEFIKAHTK